jgi:hypothetical protein
MYLPPLDRPPGAVCIGSTEELAGGRRGVSCLGFADGNFAVREFTSGDSVRGYLWVS